MVQPSQSPGRGAGIRPGNRFESVHLVADANELAEQPRITTELLPDQTGSIITENHSPDIPFRYSINPYRGCEHGCVYCYARPTHELLGLDAGLDFESKILVKQNAPERLREELSHRRWQPEPIAISGVTDCYQPAERKLEITRGLLEVMAEARQPVSLITKNALVLRDLDVLAPLAAARLVHVSISLTTLDAALASSMEPRTSRPEARLRAVRELSTAGVPVRVMVAPVIPGLNDEEIPRLLRAASEAGAASASYVMLRLPLAVEPVFFDWLARRLPLEKDRIESRIRQTRSGRLNDGRFGSRLRGQGNYAEGIARAFKIFANKYDLDRPLAALDASQFRPPRTNRGQQQLF